MVDDVTVVLLHEARAPVWGKVSGDEADRGDREDPGEQGGDPGGTPGDPTAAPEPAQGSVEDMPGHVAGVCRLLDALAEQRHPPGRIIVCGLDPEGAGAAQVRAHAAGTLPVPVLVRQARGERWERVEEVRARLPIEPGHWIWFLTSDSTPEPGALGALIAATRRSSRVGLVGPKLVHDDDPRLLRLMGHHLTPAGRGADPSEAALVDQGQLDLRQDVLGVPLAGSLVNSSVLEQSGGIDRAFGDDGVDGVDLGWRSHLAGHRVVVAPDAVVQQGAHGLGLGDPRRTRIRLRQVALARGPFWAAPRRALGVVITSIAAAILLLLVKRPREAGGEWADVLGVLSPARGWGARRRFRGRRQVHPRDLSGLHDPVSTGWSSTLEAVGDALDPRSRRTPGRGARRSAESGPVSDEFVELDSEGRVRRWSWPLTLAMLSAAALTAWAGRGLVDGLRSDGPGLSGPELGPAATDGSGLWASASQVWRGAGLGHSDAPETWLLPATAIAALFGLLPGTASAEAGPALAWMLALAPVLSVLTAYLALRRSTRRRWLRAGLALGWAAGAPLTVAISDGRLGPVVVHVLAPLMLAGLLVMSARTGGVRRTAATFASVLSVTLAAFWVPTMLVLSTAAGLGLLVLGRGSARWRGAVLAALPWALFLPFLPTLYADPLRLVGGAGATAATPLLPAATHPWQQLLLHPGASLDPATWEAVPLWLTLPLWVAAVGAVALPGLRGRRATVMIVAALTCLAGAQLAVRLSWGVLPTGHTEQGLAVITWPGTLLSLAAAALMLAAAAALDHLLPEGRRWRGGRSLLGRATAFAVVLPGVAAAVWAVSPAGTTPALEVATQPLPAVAAEQASGPGALRTVVLEVGDGEQGERVVVDLLADEPEPARILRDRAAELAIGIPDRDALESAVESLTSGVAGDQVSRELVDLGVGFVLLRADGEHPVAADLDRVSGLLRVSSPVGTVLWRMAENDPARVRVLEAGGDLVARIDAVGPHGAASGQVDVPDEAYLSVAEGPGWAEAASVRVDGEPVTVEDPSAIPLPAGQHTIEVSVDRAAWLLPLIAVLLAGITAFLALPVGRPDPEPEEQP